MAAVVNLSGGNASLYQEMGGSILVSTGNAIYVDHFGFESAEPGASLVEIDLVLPQDARVESAAFTITAAPGGATDIASVATVRPANAITPEVTGAATVDFGKLVTAGGLGYDDGVFVSTGRPGIAKVFRWTGASWLVVPGAGSFAEVGAERLLVETDDESVNGDDLAEALSNFGSVQLPAVPSSLELLVEGTTVWFERQGSTPGPVPAAPPGGVSFLVDRTVAVRDAFTRATVTAGQRTVKVSLRAANPGQLTLAPSIGALRVHLVQFPPEGISRSLDLVEEGEHHFDITPPASATEVREVSLVVRGSTGASRVQPPVGPVLTADATLALAIARSVLIGLPVALTARFGELIGVRLPFVSPATGNGAEVGGRLLLSLYRDRPGEPLTDGELAPVSVAAGTDGYLTLALNTPIELPPVPEAPEGLEAFPNVTSAWLELQLSYGDLECRLSTADAGDPAAPSAVVLRRLPGGGTTGLTLVPSIGPLGAGVRVVGLPDPDRPIPAVTLAVARATDEVGVNPTSDDLPTVLTLASPVRPVDGPVELVATVATPGTLTVDTVRVAYSEEPSP